MDPNNPQYAIIAVGCFALGIIVGKALGLGNDDRIAAQIHAQLTASLDTLQLPSPHVTVLRVEKTQEVIEG